MRRSVANKISWVMSIAAIRIGSSIEKILEASLFMITLNVNPTNEADIIAADTAITDINIFSNNDPLRATALKMIMSKEVITADSVSNDEAYEITEITVKADKKNIAVQPYFVKDDMCLYPKYLVRKSVNINT